MHFISSWQWPHLPCDVVHFNWTAVKGKRARLLPLKTMQSLSLLRARTHNEILRKEKRDWELTDHKCAGGRRAGQGCVRPQRDISQPHRNIFPFWPRVNTLWPSFCPFPLKSHSGSQVTAYTVVKIRSRWSWNVCNALFLLAGKKREDSSTLLSGFSKHAHSLNEAKYGEFIATDKSVIIDIDLKHCLSRYLNKVTNSAAFR